MIPQVLQTPFTYEFAQGDAPKAPNSSNQVVASHLPTEEELLEKRVGDVFTRRLPLNDQQIFRLLRITKWEKK